MLREPATTFEDFGNFFVSEPLDLREILRACAGLPSDVTDAEFTSVTERVLHQSLLADLLDPFTASSDDPGWDDRRRRRKTALTPYVGSVLLCVFIRLPGVHYTLEIDPELERVVHWEWQET